MRDTEKERGRDIGRRRLTPVVSLMWDSIPGPRDHDLNQRQTLNHESPRRPPVQIFFTSPKKKKKNPEVPKQQWGVSRSGCEEKPVTREISE